MHSTIDFLKHDPSSTGFSIRLVDVSMTYVQGSESIQAVDSLSLEIAAGERIAILGRSGSGKSTLLNLLGGLDQPSSGEIWIDETNIAALSTNRRAKFRRQGIGIVYQSFQLISHRDAIGNVEMPLLFEGVARKLRRQQAIRILTMLDLEDRLHHRPNQLSGGQQQRVAIARALASRPRLLLADEPTGNLDSQTANDMVELLGWMSEASQLTTVLVTHDQEIARRFATRIVTMKDGTVTSDERT